MKRVPRVTALDWVLLPVRPWTLARVAEEASDLQALLSSSLVVAVPCGIFASFLFGTISEPFPTWGVYLDNVLWAGLLGVPFGGAVGFLVPQALLFVMFPLARGRGRAGLRAILLNHVAMSLPFSALLAAWTCAGLADSSFGLLAGKPAWMTSSTVSALGSWTGATLFLGLWGLNAAWGFRGIGRRGRVASAG